MSVKRISVEPFEGTLPVSSGYFRVMIDYVPGEHSFPRREVYATGYALRGFLECLRSKHPDCTPEIHVDDAVSDREALLGLFGTE